jgi:hypothetical protein
MALGTAFSGNVKCDWCGAYIKNTDGGLTGALGLDIVKRVGAAAIPHYCSKACRVAAQQAKEGGGGSGGGGGDFAAAEAAAADAKRAEAEAKKAKIEAEQAQKAVLDAKVKEGHEAVAAVAFGEDVSSIVNNLSNLLALISRYDPKTESYTTDKDAIKSVRKAAYDKMEIGLMLLRSKGDTAQADYFQAKLQEKKDEGTLKGLGKKLGIIGANNNQDQAQTMPNPLGGLGKGLGGLFGKKK